MKKILLIEPDKTLSIVTHDYLQNRDLEIQIAEGAQEAVNSADKNEPELVILEIQLKHHNGIDFIHEFRSYPEWHKIPILIYSMIPKKEFPLDDNAWRQLGVVKYLYKPKVKLGELYNEINEILSETKI